MRIESDSTLSMTALSRCSVYSGSRRQPRSFNAQKQILRGDCVYRLWREVTQPNILQRGFIIVRLPLQPTTPHWETPSMAVRAIFFPVCHRRTARGLPNRIQTMFGRAVFYSTISMDDINAQSGWSLKTEKIRLKWHVCFDTIHTIQHLFLTWTSLYPSLHFLNLTRSYAALPLAFF